MSSMLTIKSLYGIFSKHLMGKLLVMNINRYDDYSVSNAKCFVLISMRKVSASLRISILKHVLAQNKRNTLLYIPFLNYNS